MNSRSLLFISLILSLLLVSCGPKGKDLVLESPDQQLQFTFHIGENSDALYDLFYKDRALIKNALLGLDLEDEGKSGEGVKITSSIKGAGEKTWTPVYGERAEVRDVYNSLFIDLEDALTGAQKMSLEVRAYNEGLAFRYHLSRDNKLNVIQEDTRFPFEKEVDAWVSYRAQSAISKIPLDSIEGECERPLLVEFDKNIYVALGEAGLVDFARMKFKKDSLQKNSLVSSLSGTVVSDGELISPWRYMMVADSPSELLQNNDFILNLNEPNQIEDPSWIRPGKVIREVTLTTIGGKACVDFAVKYNLQYIEFDAGWYGNEYDDASDATTITVDPKRSPGPLDLLEVIRYGESKGVGVILYVNRRSLEKQLDEVLPLLSSWGVAGIKYGFVNVGSQEWTMWLHDAVRKAADHKLMIDIHDEYRPTGYSRTYPNLMTQEGIRGDEESTPNEMVINTIFTRMIAGAGDQTNCYFAERVSETMGSHASQMAKSICIYSPWQFLFWYDRPAGSPGKKGGAGDSDGSIPDLPDLQFYSQLPTVWDQTLVVDGYPGEHVLIARQSGEQWFVGALNGLEARDFTVAMDFLDPGKEYTAILYSDDASMGSLTNVSIKSLDINQKSVISRKILERNGLAMIISPKTN